MSAVDLNLTYQTPAGWSNTPLPDAAQAGEPDAYQSGSSSLGTAAAPLYAATRSYYDAWGQLTQTRTYSITPGAAAPASNATAYLATTYDYDNRGYVTTETDPGGLVTDTSYDGAGRVTRTDVGSATQAVEYTQTTYNTSANSISVINGQLNADGSTYRTTETDQSYDAAGRLKSTTDYGTNNPLTATAEQTLVTSYEYGYDPVQHQQYMVETDPMGTKTKYAYDRLGRVLTKCDNFLSGQDQSPNTNRTTYYSYDGLNRTTRTFMWNYGPSLYIALTSQATTYAYTALSNGGSNKVITYADGTHETYQYDALGRQVKYIERDTTPAQGNTPAQDGTTHQYSYDALGSLTSDDVTNLGPNVDTTVKKLSYAYDALGRRILASSEGPLNGGWGVLNQVKDLYNGYGQVTAEYQEHSGMATATSYKVQYLYEQSSNYSRMQELVYPTGRVEWYSYHGLDASISRVTSISDGSASGQILEQYQYLGGATVIGRSLPQAGIVETTTLDSLNRVQGVDWTQNATYSSHGEVDEQTTRLDVYMYAYYPDGHVYCRQNYWYDADIETYDYDALGNQTSFTVKGGTTNPLPASLSWVVDSAGNRYDSLDSTIAHYVGQYTATNQIKGSGSSGNTTTVSLGSTSVTLRYDAWGRVVQTTPSSGCGSFAFDALGRQITTTTAQDLSTHPIITVSQAFYDGTNVIEERSANGTMVAQYVWSAAGGTRLVLRDEPGTAIPRLYALTDAAGSITSIVGFTQTYADQESQTAAHWQVVERYLYTVDGQPLAVQPGWSSNVSYSGDVPTNTLASQYNWSFLYHGLRFTEYSSNTPVSYPGLTGLYATAGGIVYDPQHGTFTHPNYSEFAPQYDPTAGETGFNGWRDRNARDIVKYGTIVISVGVGAVITVGTLGAGVGVGIAAGIAVGAALGAAGGAANAYADGADANQIGRQAALSGLIGAAGGAAGGLVGSAAGVVGSAGAELLGLGCTRVTGALVGGFAGAAGGASAGFVQGGLETGTWEGAWNGAKWGALSGGIMGAAMGAALQPVCFIAGTQVVVGLQTHDAAGRLVEVRNAGQLAAMQEAQDPGGVATADAVGYLTRSIEHLAGHKLLARDENNAHGQLVFREVEEVFTRTAYHLQTVTIRSSTGLEQTIHTTAEHPVYVLGKGWISSGQLAAGDRLQEPTGDLSEIVSSLYQRHPEGIIVYNLRVRDAHTYFVRAENSDAEPVWVHNMCGPGTYEPEEVSGLGGEVSERFPNGEYLPAAEKGYPGIGRTLEGTPDFAGTDYLHPAAGEGQQSIVRIKLSGNYADDLVAANAEGGFTEKPFGYSWHHLDYDPVTGEGTLQLVEQGAHEATYPHTGGAGQYRAYNGGGYE